MSARIARVTAIECPVEPWDWPFAREEAASIDAHWADALARKPAMFDGRVLLSRHWALAGDRLVGACFETRFRNFLAWRDFGFPGSGVFNMFSMPALRAGDGAFMLGEMSAGTSNAGKLYFPAGTPEPADIGADGRVDFAGSILRELEEETGLAPREVELEGHWTVVTTTRPVVACMRVACSPLPVETLQARLAAHNATLAAPELVRLVPVRSRDDLDATRMPDFMLSYLGEMLA